MDSEAIKNTLVNVKETLEFLRNFKPLLLVDLKQ